MSIKPSPERTTNEVRFFLIPSNADQVHETGPYEVMITLMTLGHLAMYLSISERGTLPKNAMVLTSVFSIFIPFITMYSFEGPTKELICFLFVMRTWDAEAKVWHDFFFFQIIEVR